MTQTTRSTYIYRLRDFGSLPLILNSGLRVRELTKLKMNQVDVKGAELCVIGKSKQCITLVAYVNDKRSQWSIPLKGYTVEYLHFKNFGSVQ